MWQDTEQEIMQQRRDVPWAIVLIGIVLVAAILGWYLWQPAAISLPEPPDNESPPAAEAASQVPQVPQYPISAPSSADDTERRLQPLPALDDSDEYFKLEIAGLFGQELADFMVSTTLLERLVASIDNLPRSQLAERIRPFDALPGPLAVAGQDGTGEFVLLSDNYDRYSALVEQVTTADLEQVADVYRRYYPLFQKSYVGLGYPDAYFNDRLIEVIDHLLATPEVGEPVLLVRPHVLYEFADKKLESLSSGQKLMIRIGPAHRARIKDTLQRFRALVAGNGE